MPTHFTFNGIFFIITLIHQRRFYMYFNRLLAGLFLSVIMASTSFAAVSYQLEDFIEASNKTGIDIVNVDGDNYLKGTLSPDFNIAALAVGLDINIFMPMGSTSNDEPEDFQNIVLRRLAYDHNNEMGFEWGHLKHVTMGYGLIMDNYDSMAGSTTVFSNDKAGLLAYAKLYGVGVRAMSTASEIRAGRLTYDLPNITLFNAPVIVGATYVEDANGINDNSVTRPSQQAMGVDIGSKIAGDYLEVFTEYAELTDHGKGLSAGFRGNANVVRYKAEYRSLETGFVPGYFNENYEVQSFNFTTDAPTEDLSGFLVAAGFDAMNGYIKADAQYESYDDTQLLTAALGWQQLNNTVGVINYSVPFQGDKNRVVKMDILYKTNGAIDYIVSTKRTYYEDDKFHESFTVGTLINLNKLIPGFPF